MIVPVTACVTLRRGRALALLTGEASTANLVSVGYLTESSASHVCVLLFAEACPSACTSAVHGVCDSVAKRCVCNAGYFGAACEQSVASNTWIGHALVNPTAFAPQPTYMQLARARGASVPINDTRLLVFGGVDLGIRFARLLTICLSCPRACFLSCFDNARLCSLWAPS